MSLELYETVLVHFSLFDSTQCSPKKIVFVEIEITRTQTLNVDSIPKNNTSLFRVKNVSL